MKYMSIILEGVLALGCRLFVLAFRFLNVLSKCLELLVIFLVMPAVLWFAFVFIDQPWQGIVLNVTIWSLAFMAISLLSLAIWKPKRLEKIFESL